MTKEDELKQSARNIRRHILDAANGAGKKGAHIGPSLSIAEILAVLFKGVMREADEMILSKGHGALGLYAALRDSGRISHEQLMSFGTDGSQFQTHPTKNTELGIQVSTGSLGMGLSYACGRALASKIRGESKRYYVIIGDGECQEGSIWEGAMFASRFELNNLTAIIDMNGLAMSCIEDWSRNGLPGIWQSFGWETRAVDGHGVDELASALSAESNRPCAVLAATVKGKGVSFMEGAIEWHHSVINTQQYQLAISEVENGNY